MMVNAEKQKENEAEKLKSWENVYLKTLGLPLLRICVSTLQLISKKIAPTSKMWPAPDS